MVPGAWSAGIRGEGHPEEGSEIGVRCGREDAGPHDLGRIAEVGRSTKTLAHLPAQSRIAFGIATGRLEQSQMIPAPRDVRLVELPSPGYVGRGQVPQAQSRVQIT